jgi:hypothetical protein
MANGTPLELIAVEVRADLDTLETDMAGAARVVDTNVAKITQSVQQSEQAIVRSSENAGDAMTRTGGASRALGLQFSQMGQQVAAGASPLQAIAIQLPDLAVAMGSTGAQAGSLAAFFGGPWGIALTTAAAVAAALGPKILGIGDAADEAKGGVFNLIEALARLNKAQGQISMNDLAVADVEVRRLQGQINTLQAKIATRPKGPDGTPMFSYKDLATLKDLQQQLGDAQTTLAGSQMRLAAQQRNDALDAAAEARNRNRGAPTRTRTGKTDEERAAEAAAKEAQRQDELYDKTKRQLELEQTLAALRGQGNLESDRAADKLEAIARIQEQFPQLAASTLQADQERLAVLTSIATATIDEAYNRKQAKEEADKQAKAEKEAQEQRKKAADDLARRQERQIRSLASLYEDAFRGGTDAIWKDFKDIGLRVIAETLARFTLSKLGGGGGGGSIFDFAGAALGSVLGFASGGSMTIGGRGGTDTNLLSLNGRPIANVSRGETLSVGNRALNGRGGATVVQQTFLLDNRGGVTTPELIDYINRTANAAAFQHSAAMGQTVLKAVPGRITKFQRDGT